MRHRGSVLPKNVVAFFPRVMEGVEVQRVIDVLILHLGLPVGGAVVTSLQSMDLSVSSMGDKRVLLHGVEIICERKEQCE